MKVKPFRIAKYIPLPGLLVTVRQLPTDHPALKKTPACRACGRPADDGADATWEYDHDSATINICKSLPLRRKRYLIIHELGHVVWDYMHDVWDNHRHVIEQPQRKKRKKKARRRR